MKFRSLSRGARPMSAVRVLGTAVVAMGLAAGCGQGTHSNSGPVSNPPAGLSGSAAAASNPPTAQSIPAAPASSAEATVTAPSAQVTPSAPAMANPADYYSRDFGHSFKTPSGKFSCNLGDGYATCDGAIPSTAPPIKNCAGQPTSPTGVSVGPGTPAKFVHPCSPAAPPNAKTLPYNTILRVATAQCIIREAGVVCDTDEGHGFTISDTTYALH